MLSSLGGVACASVLLRSCPFEEVGWTKTNNWTRPIQAAGNFYKPDDLAFVGGRVFVKADGDASRGVLFADLLKRAKLRMISGDGRSAATFSFSGEPKSKFSLNSFGAHFVEVTWQPEIARLRVSRVVSAMDAGRIINTLAGRNQIRAAS